MLPLKHFEITAVRKKVFGTSFIVDVMRVDRDVFHFPWKVPIATLNKSVIEAIFTNIYRWLNRMDRYIDALADMTADTANTPYLKNVACNIRVYGTISIETMERR